MPIDLNPIINSRSSLEALFEKRGLSDFKWIDPNQIVVAQWVRIKCMFGCDEYGKHAVCASHVPSVSECEKFFKEYKETVVFHFQKKEDSTEAYDKWEKQVNTSLSKLEGEVFLSGYERAFMLLMGCCPLCADCALSPKDCKHPQKARPTVDAFAVDVYTTVRLIGYPIQVVSGHSEPTNRYALLMIQ